MERSIGPARKGHLGREVAARSSPNSGFAWRFNVCRASSGYTDGRRPGKRPFLLLRNKNPLRRKKLYDAALLWSIFFVAGPAVILNLRYGIVREGALSGTNALPDGRATAPKRGVVISKS